MRCLIIAVRIGRTAKADACRTTATEQLNPFLATARPYSTVLPSKIPHLRSEGLNMQYSASARVVPRGVAVLAVPEQETALNTIAETYANFTLAEMSEFHRRCASRFQQTDAFYEDMILKGFRGSGGSPTVAAALKPASVASVAAGPASPLPPSAGDGDATATQKKPAAVKSSFDVKLGAFPPENKIKLIKELRAVTNMPLGDAKAAIDKCPGLVQSAMGKEDAEKLKAAFEALGAKVELL